MKLLLDEHLSPTVVEIVRALDPGLDIESVYDWRDARFVSQPDERILRAAAEKGRTLVTFDLRTIPSILAEFAVCEEAHAGVIFISAKSFASNDFRGLGRALVALANKLGDADWRCRVHFLSKE